MLTNLTNTSHTMTNNNEEIYFSKETSQILAKLLNVPESEIIKNYHLFSRINPYIKNCLNYLSKLETDDVRISAAYSLDYLIHFKESAFD